jgi:hypothetical protein
VTPAQKQAVERVREPDYDAEMRLPTGRSCDDCAHAKRCFGLGFSTPGRTSCDFWPNRFRRAAALTGDQP